MLSMDMAYVLNVSKGAASEAAKELNNAKLIHICEWRHNAKNGGNKVYAFGEGKDVTKPEPKWQPRERFIPLEKEPFKPRPDVAAAWMMTK